MPTTVRPFLMFEGQAEEAMRLYVSLFSDGQIDELEHFGPQGPGPEGKVAKATITIAGQQVMCFDSPVKHAFTFTPAVSLFVNCTSDDELHHLNDALSAGGTVLMELANYGFSKKFTWVNDRFGVSWQLNLP